MIKLKLKDGRGGTRPGAGRPRCEDTKMCRVPVGCIPAVKELVASYRAKAKALKD